MSTTDPSPPPATSSPNLDDAHDSVTSAEATPPGRRSTARRIVRAILAVTALLAALTTWSFGSYVLKENGDTRQQRAVSWARNHHLGRLVDIAEKRKYGDAPSQTKAATELGLDVPTSTAAASSSTSPSTSPPASVVSTTVPNAPTAPTTTLPPTTTTIAPWKIAPANVAPSVEPALDGEGIWSPIASVGGADAIWATSLRPLPQFPSVVGSFAVIEQNTTHAAMFNGSDIPGGKGWALTNRVPDDHQASLIAAFNGGFRFEHIAGGYKTEGRVVRELKNGEGTLAIDRNGKVSIGEFGRDLTDDGTYISMRQNLPLLVDKGVSQVAAHGKTWWGADFGDVIFVVRSSICVLADGRLMYGAVGKVDANMLADSLVHMGCQRAMQLDINGTWPTFETFPADADGAKHGNFLDRRMGGSRDRYLTGSSREFVAFFDPKLFPANSVVVLQTLRGLDLPPATTVPSAPPGTATTVATATTIATTTTLKK
jgi:Phosphodiester glycosidase